MANLFKKPAPVVATPAKGKGKKKDEIQMPGLEAVAQLDALLKLGASVKDNLAGELKNEAIELFMERANGKRPESFRGLDGKASASIECRKRSTASALSQAEVELLAKYNIAAQKVEMTKQLFAINPAYAGNDDLLEKVSKALEGIVPEDFIVVQEEKSKYVVDDDAMDKVFAQNCPREVVDLVSVIAIKPKLEETNVVEIMDNLKEVLAAVAPTADDEAA